MPSHYIDMVHHNPGEPLFDTKFTDPKTLQAHGFSGQAFKHINTIVTLDAIAPGVFPATPEEKKWLTEFTAVLEQEIREAKSAGLDVFYHIDLFVLPQRIVDHFGDQVLDPDSGLISMDRPKTLEIHRALFDEIFSRWPEIDGLIVRVGETYLMDTPFHTGSGAIPYHHGPVLSSQAMRAGFKKLLQFLREEICERHDRWLIHRTWDTATDKFHSNPDFYLDVTNAIPPHPRLVFSIKHTRNDFLPVWERGIIRKLWRCNASGNMTAREHIPIIFHEWSLKVFLNFMKAVGSMNFLNTLCMRVFIPGPVGVGGMVPISIEAMSSGVS